MTADVLAFVKAVGLPLGALALARTLVAQVDDRGLFRVTPFNLLPVASGAALELASLRGSGLAGRFDPIAVWSADSIWHVSWNELVARLLAPEVALVGLARVSPWHDRPTAYALTGVALGLAATGVMAAFAWRSLAAWRGPALFALLALAWMTVLHLVLVTTFWIVHWLNFWLLFILLLFVELRRREGEGSKYQAS
jgi:hypothetical protein